MQGGQGTYVNSLGRGGDAACSSDAFDFAEDGGEVLISSNVLEAAIQLLVFPVEESNFNVFLGNVEVVIFFL